MNKYRKGKSVMSVSVKDLLTESNIPYPDMLEALLAMQEDLQGNILKSHGRNYSVHLFLVFEPEKEKLDKAKVWIRDFAEKVTSVKKQREQSLCRQEWIIQSLNESATSPKKQWEPSEIYQEGLRLEQRCQSPPETLFANFFLSAKGYQTLLECTEEDIKNNFTDPTFTVGMKNENARQQINDPPLDKWDEGFGKDDVYIHSLLLLADDNPDYLGTQARVVENEVKEFAKIIHIEVGKLFKRNDGKAIEHFGFLDGISQPLFFKNDIDDEVKKEGTDKWDPGASLELVLIKDPLNTKEYSFGSYFVYRKLQQHVDRFEQKIKDLANRLDVTPEMAGAFVVGRFKDGTPITLYKETQSPNFIRNNFDYQSDTHGTRCPFHAHIRKINPRDKVSQKVTLEEVKSSRIARRGISYSYPKNNRSSLLIDLQLKHLKTTLIDTKDEEVGLLFMCFQKSITQQFVRLQVSWANSVSFPTEDTGLDPIIGQGEQQQKNNQYWPQGQEGWDENHKGRYDFSDCVQMKGGEYFFAPSISFLKHLPNFQLLKAPAESAS